VNYWETLDYLYGLQKFGIKLGLENVRTILDRLDRPEEKFPILHVGGSNGKGSVSAALAEILKQAGFRTGLYTSPHLHSFTERIRIDGNPLSEAEVVHLTREIRARSAGISSTFFEFTTAMALHYFARQRVDFAVLEVGMGGRLDATNIVTPQVSVITPVCLDHTEHLGKSVAAIAEEKAGIIKSGVPVVIGSQPSEALEVMIRKAESLDSPTWLFGRDFSIRPASCGFSFQGPGLTLENLHPSLDGAHQQENLAIALCAASLLRSQGANLPDASLRSGVEQVSWPGRLEWWNGRREILLDGAHNEGGARVLAEYLSANSLRCRWVVGLKGNKRAEEVLRPVLPFASALYGAPPPVEEPFAPDELVRMALESGVPAAGFPSPAAALEAAIRERRKGEIVLVAGSLFLVASVREILLKAAAA